MDLVDISKYRNKNKGYNWILTAVELLSRYAFTVPVLRKDTNNMTTAVTELLGQFKGRFTVYPKLAQFDDGKSSTMLVLSHCWRSSVSGTSAPTQRRKRPLWKDLTEP